MTDIELRLAEAAEALREYEVTTRRGVDLRHRMGQLAAQLASLRARHAAELRDVERLEGWSLARLLATLDGARDEHLARERVEAQAAHYRVREVQAYLNAVHREHESVQARLGELADTPRIFAALLDEKERRLRGSGDWRSARLLELAEQRGRLTGELREIDQALQAARYALRVLADLAAGLGEPANWPTGSLWRTPGLLGSASILSRLDELARAAGHADQCVLMLRTELADVPGVELAPPAALPPLAAGLATRFVDVWLEHTVSVPDRIRYARRNVDQCVWLVNDVHNRLAQRAAGVQTRLAELDGERRILLTGSAG